MATEDELVTLLGQVREGIADVEASRARVEDQISKVETSVVKLREQQAKAAELRRPDLAEEAGRRIALAEIQVSALKSQLEQLRGQEQKLGEAAEHLQARIDAPQSVG